MLERDGELSERRQCRLLGISRSSLYYKPKGESPENLALMSCLFSIRSTAAGRCDEACAAKGSGWVGTGFVG